MAKRGGARKGAGRKRGIGITYDIQRHCQRFIEDILKDEAIRLKTVKQLSLKLEGDKEECLYIIKSNGKSKIGFTSNWTRRERSYRTHLPEYKLVYLIKTQSAFDLESELHLLFKGKLVQGEWFDLNDSDLIEAISYCSSIIS